MIVDMHTHIFPSEIASMAVDKLKRASSTHPFSDGTSAGLVRSRQEAGIDCCLILPVATSPKQVSHMNDRAILTNDLYSETGLLSFGGMHPDYPDWKLELSRLARTGVKGIKFHPVYQNVDLDDLRYLRIMDRAAELGLITLTHAGLDIGFPGAVFCTPEMIVNIYRELGGIPLILAHMGAGGSGMTWSVWWRVPPSIWIPPTVCGPSRHWKGSHGPAVRWRLCPRSSFCVLCRSLGRSGFCSARTAPGATRRRVWRSFRICPYPRRRRTRFWGRTR